MVLTADYFNKRVWDFGELPDSISIEAAMACNLRCEMCPVPPKAEAMTDRKRSIMSTKTYDNIMAQIADRPRSVQLNQNGEPLLNPDIISFVQKAKNHGHFVSFTSNGTLMTRDIAQGLLEAGLDKIIFSVDGYHPSTYESIRIGAKYETVRDNILRFCELKKQLGKKTHVKIDCILSDLTKNEVSLMEEFWGPVVDTFATIPLDDWGGSLELPDKFGERNWKPRQQKTNRYPCDLLWTSMAISAEGNVMYCCHDYKLESSLPNVNDRNLQTIWNDRVAAERRKHVENRIDSQPCLKCDAWRTRNEYIDTNKSLAAIVKGLIPTTVKRRLKSLLK